MIFWFAGFVALAVMLNNVNCGHSHWSVCQASIAGDVFAAFLWYVFLHSWKSFRFCVIVWTNVEWIGCCSLPLPSWPLYTFPAAVDPAIVTILLWKSLSKYHLTMSGSTDTHRGLIPSLLWLSLENNGLWIVWEEGVWHRVGVWLWEDEYENTINEIWRGHVGEAGKGERWTFYTQNCLLFVSLVVMWSNNMNICSDIVRCVYLC